MMFWSCCLLNMAINIRDPLHCFRYSGIMYSLIFAILPGAVMTALAIALWRINKRQKKGKDHQGNSQ